MEKGGEGTGRKGEKERREKGGGGRRGDEGGGRKRRRGGGGGGKREKKERAYPNLWNMKWNEMELTRQAIMQLPPCVASNNAHAL